MKRFCQIILLQLVLLVINAISADLFKGAEYHDDDCDGVVDKVIFEIDSSISFSELKEYYLSIQVYASDSLYISGSSLIYAGEQKYTAYVNTYNALKDFSLTTFFPLNTNRCQMYSASNDSLVSECYAIDKVPPVIMQATLVNSSPTDTLTVVFSEKLSEIVNNNCFVIRNGQINPQCTLLIQNDSIATFLLNSSNSIMQGDSIRINYYSEISDIYENKQNNSINRQVQIIVQDTDISTMKMKVNKTNVGLNSDILYNLQGKKITKQYYQHKNNNFGNGFYLIKSKNRIKKLLRSPDWMNTQ